MAGHLRYSVPAAVLLVAGLAFAVPWLSEPQPLKHAKAKDWVEPAPTTAGGRFFRNNCAICHNATGTGTVTLARRLGEHQQPMLSLRDDLDPAYVETIVRNGIGSMPHFTRVELPDETMRSLQQYLSPSEARARLQDKARYEEERSQK